MFVLMKDGPSEGLNNLFELECVGTYETREDALEALMTSYDNAFVEVGELDAKSQVWLDADRLEALVADGFDYGVALRVFKA